LLSKNNKLYRARIISPDSKKNIIGSSRLYGFDETASMAPPKGKATAGRANPKHIPYLYASFDEQTAMSEVRPIRTDKVNLATIEIEEDLKVLVFDDVDPFNIASTYAEAISILLSRDFFVPVKDSEDEEYVVTQFIANYISKREYDGICYRSAMNPSGLNICIFNYEKKCKVVETTIMKVCSVEVNYRNTAKPLLRSKGEGTE
jgi:RES domain-containing protein